MQPYNYVPRPGKGKNGDKDKKHPKDQHPTKSNVHKQQVDSKQDLHAHKTSEQQSQQQQQTQQQQQPQQQQQTSSVGTKKVPVHDKKPPIGKPNIPSPPSSPKLGKH